MLNILTGGKEMKQGFTVVELAVAVVVLGLCIVLLKLAVIDVGLFKSQ